MDNQEPKNMHEQVLEAIKSGRVAMRPRWHFVAGAILAAVIGILAALILVYLFSLMVFLSRENGSWFISWLLIVCLIFFAILLEMLLQRYAFAYRRPLLVTILGITIVVMLTGYVVGRTSLHRHLRGPVYQRYHHRPPHRLPRPQGASDFSKPRDGFRNQVPKFL
jgi:hypothetical protein